MKQARYVRRRNSLHNLAFLEIFDCKNDFGFEKEKLIHSMIRKLFLVSGNLSLDDSFTKLYSN